MVDLVGQSNQFNGDIPIPENFPVAVPLGGFNVVQLRPNLYFATQQLLQDDACPYGIFPMSVAVDRSKQAAITRARYEAAERYALAAVLGGHEFISASVVPANKTFRFPISLIAPLNGGGRSIASLYLRFSEIFNMEQEYVAIADVFAPYPVKSGECTWHPTTNGVAVGASYQSAKMASFFEFVERHSIMQYWYNGASSYLIEKNLLWDSATEEVRFLNELGYELTCIEISTVSSIYIVLIFAHNRASNYPFSICSAGSGNTINEAIRKAAQETVQTLIACASQTDQFLRWKAGGGKIHSLDHRMFFYADLENEYLIRSVVAAISAEAKKLSVRIVKVKQFEFSNVVDEGLSAAFVNITPSSWRSPLQCVRCYSATMIPLLVSEAMVNEECSILKTSRFGLPHPFP